MIKSMIKFQCLWRGVLYVGANKKMNHQQPINNHDKYEVYRIRMYNMYNKFLKNQKKMEY